MTSFIIVLLLIPLAGFLVSLVVPSKNEKLISRVVFTVTSLQLFICLAVGAFWLASNYQTFITKNLVVFKSASYQYNLGLLLDTTSYVFLLTGAFLTFLVTRYSSRYLHREEGYKRFFYTILLFFLGYNITVLAVNFETLYIGWEILGISSFLLISFYRDRYLPVKNAVKVFSVFRLADIGILLAIWANHHLWNTNVSFQMLADYPLVDKQLQLNNLAGMTVSVMIVLAAAVKSAQLPFSSWLARAMEGPTPSTAIFYGALSVHIGVFLLLRTGPLWHHQAAICLLIGVIGALTAAISTGICRVQSSIKGQIAYASISQIGLIFVEIALGLESLALLHFAGNAFLRTAQLLVSPSIVSQMLVDMYPQKELRTDPFKRLIPQRLRVTFYMLSLKEWGQDDFMYRFLWSPFKRIGIALGFLNSRLVTIACIITYLTGVFYWLNPGLLAAEIAGCLPVVFSLAGLLMLTRSFSERKDVRLSWIQVSASHFWIALAVAFNETVPAGQLLLYLSGTLVAALTGYGCLSLLRRSERHIGLSQFHGHIQMHKQIGIAFFISCLGLSGFPITPTVMGEELIFSHIHQDQILLAWMVSLSCVIGGLSVIRIYARIFLGPAMRSRYELTYRSS